jgi:hypothetical protein
MTWNSLWAPLSAVTAVVVGIIVIVHPFNLGRETKDLLVETVSSALLADLSDPGLSS